MVLEGPTHTTPRGTGPHGPSLGPPPKHTVPLGVSSHAIWPVYLNTLCHLAWIYQGPYFKNPRLYSSRVSTPTGGSSKHTVPLGPRHVARLSKHTVTFGPRHVARLSKHTVPLGPPHVARLSKHTVTFGPSPPGLVWAGPKGTYTRVT